MKYLIFGLFYLVWVAIMTHGLIMAENKIKNIKKDIAEIDCIRNKIDLELEAFEAKLQYLLNNLPSQTGTQPCLHNHTTN